MKKITLLFAFMLFCFFYVNSQTVFNMDSGTAVDNGDNITETIDNITLTFTGVDDEAQFYDFFNLLGSTGNIAVSTRTPPTILTTVVFSFSEPVTVNSILAIESLSPDINYVFTPTGGTNLPVNANITANSAIVNLNWTDVTSFTVTSTVPMYFGFDDLSVTGSALSTDDKYYAQKAIIYPNPVENLLYVKNITNLKSINIYDSLGQLVLQSEEAILDFSNLSKGIYFLKIISGNGIETKRIIKK